MRRSIRKLSAALAVILLFCAWGPSGRAGDDEPGMIYFSCDLALPEYCEYIVPENCYALNADEWMADSYYRAAITLFTILDFFGLQENYERYGDYMPYLFDDSYVGRDDIRLYILCQDARAGHTVVFIDDVWHGEITGILFDAEYGYTFSAIYDLVRSYCADGFEKNANADLAEWYNIIQKLYP